MAGISVQSSMALQNFGHSAATGLSLEYDRLSMQKKQIEHDKTLSDKEKEQQLAQIEQQMQQLMTEIANANQKEETDQKAEQYKEEKKQLTEIYNPKTAEMMMQLEEMMKFAGEAETADLQSEPGADGVSELAKLTEENANIAQENTNTAQEEPTDLPSNTITEQLLDYKDKLTGDESTKDKMEKLQQAIKEEQDKTYGYQDELEGYFVDERR